MPRLLHFLSQTRHDDTIPWPVLLYMGIGFAFAYWYQRREGHPEREHHARAQFLVLLVLAMFWPILLLAVLVNQPDPPKPDKAARPADKPPAEPPRDRP